MKLIDINLDYVKKYLNINHDLDDSRLQSHIDTAINYIVVSHGYKNIEEADNDLLSDLAMLMIQDLYDNGTITTEKPISFLTIDRRF